jgi:hypothetical protein
LTGRQSAVSPPLFDQDAAATPADIVVALPGTSDGAGLRSAITAVRGGAPPGLHVLLIHRQEAEPAQVDDDGTLTLTAQPVSPIDRMATITPLGTDTYRSLFTLTHRVGARAAVVLGSDPGALSPGVVQALVHPILDQGVDIVTPLYARGRFEGLINSAVVYPLTRALYGKRIRGQMGLDFAFSGRLAVRWRTVAGAGGSASRPAWIIAQALADELTVGQANLSVRLQAAKGSSDLSSTLTMVLGSLFSDLERRAPFWQKVRWSEPVPTFGEPSPAVADSDPFNVQPFIESFQLAYRNLQDVWGLVLPPATLVDLKRLTVTPLARFRMPDDLWARIVYDFVVGHRLRALNRDHLLAALTPIYLAWVASHALEVGLGSRAAGDELVERLCDARV